jgi:hypothetical protein
METIRPTDQLIREAAEKNPWVKKLFDLGILIELLTDKEFSKTDECWQCEIMSFAFDHPIYQLLQQMFDDFNSPDVSNSNFS